MSADLSDGEGAARGGSAPALRAPPEYFKLDETFDEPLFRVAVRPHLGLSTEVTRMGFWGGIAILGGMLAVASLLVWRGFRTPPDDTNNRAKGGGAKWDYWRD
ncbi:hypothetical protein CLN94_05590 [Pseudothioclava arenosa]|uniref:Uncharacterized protein n=1 Tax=Pseudothioclava arenosa TaxID=1795308 RepID=A0A2A4CML6_9RHOB|nr:hypothetical protein CLN94_05590 [Pseudothioclava arenosa]